MATSFTSNLWLSLKRALGLAAAHELNDKLNTLGVDGSGSFTTLVATTGDINVLTADEITMTGTSGVVDLSPTVVRINAALHSVPPADQVVTNGATITLSVSVNVVVSNAGNVTGIIMEAGSVDGQIVNVINAGSGSVTFATAGTSNVADGTSAVIATLRAVTMVWDLGSLRWYRTG